MSYGLNNRRYSVLHINHPDNPKPTIYSAYRDYGRFGSFFTHKIKPVVSLPNPSGETLALHYRIWVAQSQMPDRQSCAGKYSAFVEPPKTSRIPQ
jgi:hypothetical protein